MIAVPFVLQAARFSQLACAFMVLYDHALTLTEEVELIWKKKWAASHILFLANRYVGALFFIASAVVYLSEDLTSNTCGNWFRVQAWLSSAILWTVQAIMLYRVSAMHEKTMRVTVFMTVCFLLQIAVMSAIIGLASDVSGIPYSRVITVCEPKHVPQRIYLYWLPALVFELVLFCLAFAQGYSHAFKFTGGNWWCPRLLMGILMRDTVVHFLVCYTLYFGNALVWAFLPPVWMQVSAPFAIAVTCVMGSRLVLNLREAYYLPAQDEFVPGQTNYYDHRIARTQAHVGAVRGPRRKHSTTFRVAPARRNTPGSAYDEELEFCHDEEYDCELSPISDDFRAPELEKDAGGGMATSSFGSSTLANSSGAGSAKAREREESANSYRWAGLGMAPKEEEEEV